MNACLFFLLFAFICFLFFLEEKERFCNQSEHKKILDKGIPDDVPPGYRDRHVSFDRCCIFNLCTHEQCKGYVIVLSFLIYFSVIQF